MPNPHESGKEPPITPAEGVAEAVASYAAALGPNGAREFTRLLNQFAPFAVEDHCDLWAHVGRHPGIGGYVAAAMRELTSVIGYDARFELRWSPAADTDPGEPVLCVRLRSYPQGILRTLAQVRSLLRSRGFAAPDALVITTDFGGLE